MALNLSEIFYSIQGEGPFIGRPSIFVRFSGCNLRCKWGDNLCDTPYTSWNPETNQVALDELIEQIKAASSTCKNIVITGGEPTLQKEFDAFCLRLKSEGYLLDIETNGTLPIPDSIDQIICSPKLSDSTPTGTKFAEMHECERKKLSAQVSGKNPKVYLKFVVSDKTDLDELKLVVESTAMPSQRVYLMPEGLSSEAIQKQSVSVSDLALQLGYNFTTRLHILIWGNKRGV